MRSSGQRSNHLSSAAKQTSAMPRDLFASQSTEDPALTSSPSPQTPQFGGGSTATGEDGYNEFTIHRDEPSGTNAQLRDWRARSDEKNDLHPYVQTLSRSNVDSCVALEDSVFPEHERCSKEKVRLRSSMYPIKSPHHSFLMSL